MKLNLTIFFAFAGFFLLGQKASVINIKYSVAQQKQDLQLMKSVYLKMHPVIGIYDDKSFAEIGFDKLMNSLKDSLTERDFRIKVRQFIRTLKCGHTDVLPSKAFLNYYKYSNHLPYQFIAFENEIYVYGGRNKNKDTLLKEKDKVISINGISPSTIIDYSKSIIPADGTIESSKKLFSQETISSYIINYFNQPDSLLFEVSQNNITKTYWIKLFKSKIAQGVQLKQKDTLYKEFKKARIKYKYLDAERNTCHMKIAGFSHRKYSKAYKHIFRELNKNKCENLIIDLRYNGGGSLSNSNKLIKYLLKDDVPMSMYTRIKKYPYKKHTHGNIAFRLSRFFIGLNGKKTSMGDSSNYASKIKTYKKHHYNGNIYVLINGGSFSASCLVSAYLKNCSKSILIGQETGGTEEGCNAVIMPRYTLPNTKIRFRIPSYRLQHDVYKKGNTARGILPTYEINYTLDDYYNKKDLELEKVKELINSK